MEERLKKKSRKCPKIERDGEKLERLCPAVDCSGLMMIMMNERARCYTFVLSWTPHEISSMANQIPLYANGFSKMNFMSTSVKYTLLIDQNT
jgi:hypothetical protein